MSVLANDRYEKITANAGQTVFNYDWDVPSANPEQVKVIWLDIATGIQRTLNFGSEYTVDISNKTVTLVGAAAAINDIIVIYSGTPEIRETDFTGSSVSVSGANAAIDNLTYQTQQLARDVKRCLRVDMVEGIMPNELPPVDERKNKYASWDNDGYLTYDDPVTGVLQAYMRKDQNLSDVANVDTARANLGLGNSATRNVGTTAGTVCAGDDSRFLTQAQKDALTNGGDANGMHIHSGYIQQSEKGSANGVASLDATSKIPNNQLPSNVVTSETQASADGEVVVFNGVGGNSVKRSNKQLPNSVLVGTTDVQALTNKTIDADSNTIQNIEVDNLKAGVLNTNLSGATSDLQIPSSKATKDYADTKVGTLHNLGEGVEVGHDITNGRLSLRTFIAKDGIQFVQNENDIYVYGVPSETTFPKFDKQGNGADWYKQTSGIYVEYRSFTGSNGITVSQKGDEIDSSLTNISEQGDMIVGDGDGNASTLARGEDNQVLRMNGNAPGWETLGTMSDQDSNNVNITGGEISGISDLAIADGGTAASTKTEAFDNLSPLTTAGDVLTHDGNNNVRLGVGNPGEVLKVSAGGDGVEWGSAYATPTTTQGDLIVRGPVSDERFGIGTAGQVLSVNSEANSPEWKTLGTMSTQDASSVNITGGTITGLSSPLPFASGGTGLSALGTAGQVLSVNGSSDGLSYHEYDCLDVVSLKSSLADATDLNTILLPGTYWMANGSTAVNKPAFTTDSSIRITVKQINATTLSQTVSNILNETFFRTYDLSSTAWGSWILTGTNLNSNFAKTNLTNLTQEGTTAVAHYARPSGRNFGLTLGASGSEYKAPADGYVYFQKITNAIAQYIVLTANAITSCDQAFTEAMILYVWIPVKKNDLFYVHYTAEGNTESFTFIYAEGAY